MGHVKKAPSGRWRAIWHDPDSGREVSRTFNLKREADKELTHHESKIAEGTYVDPRRGEIRLANYWATFLAGSSIRPTTLARYQAHWERYIAPSFGERSLASIRAEDVRAWRSELVRAGIGAPTIESALRILKTVMNRAVSDERIARSPARNVANPSTSPEGGMRVLEVEQLARLADAVPDRYRALVWLLGLRGLRIGEAVALRVGDVDGLRGRITVSKTMSEVGGELVEGPPKTAAGSRVVSMPPFLRDLLTAHVAAFSDPTEPTAFVFTSPGGGPGRVRDAGGPIRPSNFRRRVFARAVAIAGLDPNLTPHDLRDSSATISFANGASVKEVATMLGHSDPSVTLRIYTGVLDSMQARTDERLESSLRELDPNLTACSRPVGGSNVVTLPAVGS